MIYLASPYSHPDPFVMKNRFLLVEQATAYLLANKVHVYSPIVHCHELSQKYKLPTDFDFWRSYNLDMIRRCSAFSILGIPGWLQSKGVRGETEFAFMCGMRAEVITPEGQFVEWLRQWPA